MVWSSKLLGQAPVQILINEFCDTKGLITTIDDEGGLYIQYLGTDPPTTSVIQNVNQNVNYDAIEKEHKQLMNAIRAAQSAMQTEPSDTINITSQIPDIIDEDSPISPEDGIIAKTANGHVVQISVKLFLTYTGVGTINNVTVGISVYIINIRILHILFQVNHQ